jgi:hypothetical protein
MGTFQKPQPSKPALKLGLYGPAGSGKTFTALLIAEGLAQPAPAKRVAVVDTEQGTAFYGQDVPARQPHPKAFDFDVLHSRSITEVLAAVRQIDPARHGVVVIDSISHLWDSCKNAYTGKLTRQGSIPFHAWAAIKTPYRELMHLLLTARYHVLICGRQAVEYGEDEATGELAGIGYRMRAEGETGYEPDVLLRLEQRRGKNEPRAVPVAHVEKDRTGVQAGTTIPWPGFDNVARPLLGLLGQTQAAPPGEDEVARLDAEVLAREAAERERQSREVAATFAERFGAAATQAELAAAGQALTPGVKAKLTAADLEQVRRAYGTRQAEIQRRAQAATGTEANGTLA